MDILYSWNVDIAFKNWSSLEHYYIIKIRCVHIPACVIDFSRSNLTQVKGGGAEAAELPEGRLNWV